MRKSYQHLRACTTRGCPGAPHQSWCARHPGRLAEARAADPDALPAGWEWCQSDACRGMVMELHDHGNWRGNAYRDGIFVIRGSMEDHRAPERTFGSAKRALVAELRRRGVMP